MPIIKVIKQSAGQGLLEIILALAIFTVSVSGLILLIVDGNNLYLKNLQSTQAQVFLQEGLEAVRSIKADAWNRLNLNSSGLKLTDHWEFLGEGTVDQPKENYTRAIQLEDIYRFQGIGEIVSPSLPEAVFDPGSKRVTVNINWTEGGQTRQWQTSTLLTNWLSATWLQTDWQGGGGQAVWAEPNKFLAAENIDYATSGEIKLAASISNNAFNWDFNQATDYLFDPDLIEINNGEAKLKLLAECTGQVVLCGSFSQQTACQSQQGCLWQTIKNCSGSCDCTKMQGIQGLVFCYLCPHCQVNWVGGNWSCTNNDMNASCSNDANYECYFCSQAGCNWNVKRCTGQATACASFVSQPSCQGQQGCQWSSGYSSLEPTVQLKTPLVVPDLLSWSGLVETATKNGGEIYYQLSDGNGLNWYYWDGSNWVITVDNYNIATVINDHLASFPLANKQIKFKAFLQSDGEQQVILDNVTISYSSGTGAGYEIAGWLESSAINLGSPKAWQIIQWQEAVEPNCQVKLQIKTAATQIGLAPAEWSGPEGQDGDQTDYFINYAGQLISPDHNGDSWLQYKVFLTGDGAKTPTLSQLAINYK